MVETLTEVVWRAVRQDEGQNLIEYALLATFVSLVVIATATILGESLSKWYVALGHSASVAAGNVGS